MAARPAATNREPLHSNIRAVGLPGAPKTEQRGGFILLGRRAPLAPQLLLEPELLVLLKLRLVPDVDTLAESGIRPRIVEATLPLVDQDPSLSQPLHVRQLLGGVREPLLEAGGLEAFLVRLSIALSVGCTPGHGEHSGDNQDPHADRGHGSRLPPRQYQGQGPHISQSMEPFRLA